MDMNTHVGRGTHKYQRQIDEAPQSMQSGREKQWRGRGRKNKRVGRRIMADGRRLFTRDIADSKGGKRIERTERERGIEKCGSRRVSAIAVEAPLAWL